MKNKKVLALLGTPLLMSAILSGCSPINGGVQLLYGPALPPEENLIQEREDEQLADNTKDIKDIKEEKKKEKGKKDIIDDYIPSTDDMVVCYYGPMGVY